jgi:hypothetical protein
MNKFIVLLVAAVFVSPVFAEEAQVGAVVAVPSEAAPAPAADTAAKAAEAAPEVKEEAKKEEPVAAPEEAKKEEAVAAPADAVKKETHAKKHGMKKHDKPKGVKVVPTSAERGYTVVPAK